MWKLEAFVLKIITLPRLLPCCIYYGLVAGIWYTRTQKFGMGLVGKLETMQQLTIIVTFFKSKEYSHRSVGIELV